MINSFHKWGVPSSRQNISRRETRNNLQVFYEYGIASCMGEETPTSPLRVSMHPMWKIREWMLPICPISMTQSEKQRESMCKKEVNINLLSIATLFTSASPKLQAGSIVYPIASCDLRTQEYDNIVCLCESQIAGWQHCLPHCRLRPKNSRDNRLLIYDR